MNTIIITKNYINCFNPLLKGKYFQFFIVDNHINRSWKQLNIFVITYNIILLLYDLLSFI